MLTRFEVSGFKNLKDVVVDFGPFTCIAGPNGVGKSNLFDAIHLLSRLAQYSFSDAFRGIRETPRQRGTVRSTLPPEVLSGDENLRLAAEMILRPTARTSNGETKLSNTYVRYELELSVQTKGDASLRLALVNESLKTLPAQGACLWQCSEVRDYLVGEAEQDVISTGDVQDNDDGRGTKIVSVEFDEPVRLLSRDFGGIAAGLVCERDRTSLVDMSFYSAVVQAVREELASWRFLSLEPAAIRVSDDIDETDPITSQGGHLPSFLRREELHRGQVVYQQLQDTVADLVDLRAVSVTSGGGYLELHAKVGEGPEVPARSLSDGTLRFLALGVLDIGETSVGLLGIEEPENGIHPGKIAALVELLRSLAEPRDGFLRQVIVNTHSPYLVQQIERSNPGDLLVARSMTGIGPQDSFRSLVTFQPLPNTWRADGWKEGRGVRPVPRGEIAAYLENPMGWERGDNHDE
ncbi:AAA family ATPase [Schaalia cardiffensis]|mgnify:FL=1|uniref:AAA family ATPase n=1 Tax=Schaalia cardiffensis TaxID=181487 RepID=UPI0023F0E061|nr:ATP-binding protein [Schaalia cardiffensis]